MNLKKIILNIFKKKIPYNLYDILYIHSDFRIFLIVDIDKKYVYCKKYYFDEKYQKFFSNEIKPFSISFLKNSKLIYHIKNYQAKSIIPDYMKNDIKKFKRIEKLNRINNDNN